MTDSPRRPAASHPDPATPDPATPDDGRPPDPDLPNAVLVGGPLAGRAIRLPALDRPVVLSDDHGLPQEYRPSGAAVYIRGRHHPELVVFHYFGSAR